MDRHAARKKERFLTQILGAHHARQQGSARSGPRAGKAGQLDGRRMCGVGGGAEEHRCLGLGPERGRCAEWAEGSGEDSDESGVSSSSMSDSEYNLLLDALSSGRHRESFGALSNQDHPPPPPRRRLGLLVKSVTTMPMLKLAGVPSPPSPSGKQALPTAGRRTSNGEVLGSTFLGEFEAETPLEQSASTSYPRKPCTPRVQLRVSAKRPWSAPHACCWGAAKQLAHNRCPSRQQPGHKAGPAATASLVASAGLSVNTAAVVPQSASRRTGAGGWAHVPTSPRELLRPGSRPRPGCKKGGAVVGARVMTDRRPGLQ